MISLRLIPVTILRDQDIWQIDEHVSILDTANVPCLRTS